jgi:P63C domain
MSADIIPFRIERQDDGELRISDAEMADRLGYSTVKDFRSLVRRHAKTLNKFNVLRAVQHRNEMGGRPSFEYFLTEQQAIFVVAKSEMPKAIDITVAIVKAFVAFKRTQINPNLYGVVGMELLGFAPRGWQKEYPDSFFVHLHRIGGWAKPDGNNHSNCSHFINKYIYEFLFGELGLRALKEANPADEGVRIHKHHQMLKDKHMPRLRTHIELVAALLANAMSLGMFDDAFNRVFPRPNTQVGFLFNEFQSGAA